LKKVANSGAFNDENPNIVISDKKNLLVPSNCFAFLKLSTANSPYNALKA